MGTSLTVQWLDSELLLQGAGVVSPVGNLRPHMLCGVASIKQREREREREREMILKHNLFGSNEIDPWYPLFV